MKVRSTLQTRYGALTVEANRIERTPISGGTIVFITAGGRVQSRDVGATYFSTCDGGEPIAAPINLIKVS